MPPTLADRVRHMLEAIDLIETALAKKSFEEFSADALLRSAVERLLEKISEASRYVPADRKAGESGISWQKMADLGNRLRHAYHNVDPTIVWEIAKNDLAPLRTFVEKVLQDEP